jgi:hypothetical protein
LVVNWSSAGVLLAARACSSPTGSPPSSAAERASHRNFLRTGGDLVQIVLDLFQVEAREQLGAARRQLRQLAIGQQRLQQMAAADLRLRVVLQIQRSDQPGVFKQLGQARREHRRARIAVLEALHFRAQVRFQLADADIALARDQRHVALRLLQQRQEQMFDIDLVLAQRHAQAGGARGGGAAGVVQFADQRFQIDAHVLILL